MKNVTKINQVDFSIFKKTRVAAYCRVSTDSDEQELSLDTQKNHYESYIKANSEWEYAGIYYDDGVSGTKTAKRDGLLRLMEDCEKGLIDLVITKSISRFSRNTTDCLALVRKLLNYEVYVIFEKENINTGSMESELMLAVLASMAESESRSISENEKWGIKKRFQNGTYVISYPPYGYANVDGEMVIVPEQAEVVKEIFAGCLAGKSTQIIAKELNEKGVPTKKGAKWTGGTINGILTNEKYIGDALFQKTITDASFKRKRNYGEEEQYYCEDHHEPIIDKDTFEKAKEAIRQRGLEKGNCSENTAKYQNRYAMSGKIKCGECGRSFKRRYHYTSHGRSYNAWCCGGHIEDSSSCSMKFIRDDDLKRAFLTMMNKLVFGNDLVLKPLLISITTNNSKKNANSVEDIEKEMKSNEEQRKQLNTLLTNGYLERPVFAEAHNKLITEYEHLEAERDLLFRMDDAGYTMEQALKELVDFLNDAKPFTEWKESLFERFIEKVKVLSRDKVEFEFKCGLKLKERAHLRTENGKRKRVYSSKYALSSIIYCGKCGDLFRRVAWKARGASYNKWRCASRIEKGPKNGCDAEAISESEIQKAVMRAINKTLGGREEFLAQLQHNIEDVLNGDSTATLEYIDQRMAELQEKLVMCVNKNAEYDVIAKEIDALREKKAAVVTKDAEQEMLRKRINEMRHFLQTQTSRITEYDEQLVRRLIEKITVYDDKLIFEFKSGMTVELKR